MDMHFFSTGTKFPYVYYLAVMSALKTQKADRINLRVLSRPDSVYFERIVNDHRVNVIDIEMPEIIIKAMPQQDDGGPISKIKASHTKDYLGWEILYEQGGILIDLDTFCIMDLCGLLSDKEVATSVISTEISGPGLFPFNNDVIIAKPKSAVIKYALDETVKELTRGLREGFFWGVTGPVAFSNAVHRYYHLVNFLPPGTLGIAWEKFLDLGKPAYRLYKDDGEIRDITRMVHLIGSAHKEIYDMDSVFIMKSNVLYARLVRNVLDESEWNIKR